MLSIPETFEFIGDPMLNEIKMRKILKRVEGVTPVNFLELGSYKASIEWLEPVFPPWWQNPPVSWLLSSLLSGIIILIPISYVSSKLWNWLQKPKLTIDVVPREDGKEPAIHPRTNIAFYHLRVMNKVKSTAYDSETYITFKNSDGEVCLQLEGKWDRGPEPLGPVQRGGRTNIWPSLIPFSGIVNIRPDIPETFCIVIKDNEDLCHAFNANSYFHPMLKLPRYRLPVGEYTVEVDVRSGNAKISSKFLLENTGNTTDGISIQKLD